MTVQNTYSIFFSAAQIAKGDPENLLDWQNRWPNFSANELASKGDGSLLVNYAALDALQRLRTMWRRPMKIGSAYRDPQHNERVGGAPRSMHLTGRAFDISVHGWADSQIVAFIYYAVKAEFTGFGMYMDRPYPFIHIDTGRPRTWQSGQSRLDDTDDVTELTPA